MLKRNLQEIQSPETILEQYRINKAKIKQLEEINNNLKNLIVTHYMQDTDILKSSDGLTLATYKSSLRVTFNTKELEKNHKDIYEKYADLIEVKTFLVK